jgi:hypothetical protein
MQASAADCIYTAKCVGQLVQVKMQGLECVDLLTSRSPYIQCSVANVYFVLC